jgi:L-serine dehydratase
VVKKDMKSTKNSKRDKKKILPSIFNDVIGPVMRGPSSSHCAAALRIGRMARDLMEGNIKEVLVEYDPNGSLVMTHAGQGSDMGLCGGLLGWDAQDERLAESAHAVRDAGIKVKMKISRFSVQHPNTYKMTLENAPETHTLQAISTGGGIIEVIELDGIKLSMAGDYYETIIYCDKDEDKVFRYLKAQVEADEIIAHKNKKIKMIEIKAQRFPEAKIVSELKARFNVKHIKNIAPVLPVLSRKKMGVPFISCEEMLAYNKDKNLALWELAVLYESVRGNMPPERVLQEMQKIVAIMQKGILKGIAGTQYADRILGNQSGLFNERMKKKQLLDTGLLNRIVLYVSAMMEIKSAMGVIVAAPTAGACGALPGACMGAASAMGLSLEEMTKAMLAAGLIGVFIAAQATFAAEVGGCQAECGAGSGMAAAALVTLARGSVKQAVDAASMALQNILGMVCDPVAGRVEVPCLGKNVMAAANALACANMALAGYDVVIPLDEVIDAMDRVGRSLPVELRCTALGGLSMTRSSKLIEKKLKMIHRKDAKVAKN